MLWASGMHDDDVVEVAEVWRMRGRRGEPPAQKEDKEKLEVWIRPSEKPSSQNPGVL
jgi:hypothetical protein